MGPEASVATIQIPIPEGAIVTAWAGVILYFDNDGSAKITTSWSQNEGAENTSLVGAAEQLKLAIALNGAGRK